MLSSTAKYDNSFQRFKRVHELICRSPRFKHVPAIVTEEIEAFPEAVAYIKSETLAGRMTPQLHGLRHIDYGKLPQAEVVEHLIESRRWFSGVLGYHPSIWYTPWGANQPHLHAAAVSLGMEAVDCSTSFKLKGRYGVPQLMRDGKKLDYFAGKAIIIHWWNALDVERLELLVEASAGPSEHETSTNN